MSDLLRWFGEQSEAVKLALIAGVTGIVGGILAALKELRKPVLAAQPVTTTATAPRAVDDPILLLLAEVSAINMSLAQLIAVTSKVEDNQDERIEKVVDHVKELTSELYLLRNSLNNRSMGM